jgi:hypothetical protein
MRLFIASVLFVSQSVFASNSEGRFTLKDLAQASSFLLWQSELVLSGKSACFQNSMEISTASQKLKSMVDEKIGKLSKNDYKILKNRIKNCNVDCSCPIYQLAFEKASEAKIEVLSTQLQTELEVKSRGLSADSHRECAKVNKWNCRNRVNKLGLR